MPLPREKGAYRVWFYIFVRVVYCGHDYFLGLAAMRRVIFLFFLFFVLVCSPRLSVLLLLLLLHLEYFQIKQKPMGLLKVIFSISFV
ncbi:hypothetical protein P305_09095 [Xylella fastidiosa subsp. fastidiosa Mus-1]|nr:hypothetical protein P305_09095 [Xylella fastidiosa subsp. fastidiosa Mus-1]